MSRSLITLENESTKMLIEPYTFHTTGTDINFQ